MASEAQLKKQATPENGDRISGLHVYDAAGLGCTGPVSSVVEGGAGADINSYNTGNNINVEEYAALKGKYTIVEKIGHGAQATVFKARSASGEWVAIKVFDLRSAENWKSVDLLKREVETLKNINVKGTPAFIEFIDSSPLYYLVESYISGQSMEALIKSGFRPTEIQVVEILVRSLMILSRLHSLAVPVIHRDIKPGNLLVDISPDGIKVNVVDFGTVAAIRQHTNASTFAGTAGYLAPEQLYGRALPASDIYGLGMSVIHLVTGMAPYEMEMEGLTLMYEKYLPESMSPWLRTLLSDMVQSNPNDRAQNANELLLRIRQHVGGEYAMFKSQANLEPVSVEPDPKPPDLPKLSVLQKVLAVTGSVMGLVILIAWFRVFGLIIAGFLAALGGSFLAHKYYGKPFASTLLKALALLGVIGLCVLNPRVGLILLVIAIVLIAAIGI